MRDAGKVLPSFAAARSAAGIRRTANRPGRLTETVRTPIPAPHAHGAPRSNLLRTPGYGNLLSHRKRTRNSATSSTNAQSIYLPASSVCMVYSLVSTRLFSIRLIRA